MLHFILTKIRKDKWIMLVQNTAQMSSFLTVISNNKDIRLNKSLKNKVLNSVRA